MRIITSDYVANNNNNGNNNNNNNNGNNINNNKSYELILELYFNFYFTLCV